MKIKKIAMQYLDYLGKYRHDKSLMHALRTSAAINDPRAALLYADFFRFLPKEALSTSGVPSYAENAIFLTAKIYAILQHDANENINDPNGIPFFQALKVLHDPNSNRFEKRINNLLLTNSFVYAQQALPQLAKMLAHKTKQPIDLTQLAYDLYQMQFDFDSSKKVVLRWGQNYYAAAISQ